MDVKSESALNGEEPDIPLPPRNLFEEGAPEGFKEFRKGFYQGSAGPFVDAAQQAKQGNYGPAALMGSSALIPELGPILRAAIKKSPLATAAGMGGAGLTAANSMAGEIRDVMSDPRMIQLLAKQKKEIEDLDAEAADPARPEFKPTGNEDKDLLLRRDFNRKQLPDWETSKKGKAKFRTEQFPERKKTLAEGQKKELDGLLTQIMGEEAARSFRERNDWTNWLPWINAVLWAAAGSKSAASTNARLGEFNVGALEGVKKGEQAIKKGQYAAGKSAVDLARERLSAARATEALEQGGGWQKAISQPFAGEKAREKEASLQKRAAGMPQYTGTPWRGMLGTSVVASTLPEDIDVGEKMFTPNRDAALKRLFSTEELGRLGLGVAAAEGGYGGAKGVTKKFGHPPAFPKADVNSFVKTYAPFYNALKEAKQSIAAGNPIQPKTRALLGQVMGEDQIRKLERSAPR